MATTLIRRAKILASARADCLVGADLLLRDDRIVEIGSGLQAQADHVLDARGNLVMPGLIQTHVHLCQTPLIGSAGDVTLMDWLRERTWPLEAAHDEQTLYDSLRWGALRLVRSGTTAIIDHETVRHTSAAMQAILDSGIRAQSGKVLMDHPQNCPPYLCDDTAPAIDETVELIGRWHGVAEGRLTYGLNPRFAVSCTDGLLRGVGELADAHSLPIHIHAHEESVSIGMVERERGKRPIPHLADLGLLGPLTQLVHCVHLTEEERTMIAAAGAHVCHCPSSNLVLGSGVAPVPELRSAGVNVGIGSDATAFNPPLDGFLEMRDAALVQSGRLGPTAVTGRDVLEMATLDGAKALGLGDQLGTAEVGMKADLIIVEVEPSLHADSEAEGVVHSLVFDPTAVRVLTTIVDGRVLMEDGRVKVFDEGEVEARGRRAQAKLLERIRRL